jgi:hypothetical protein
MLNAQAISTYSIVVWGSNTLTVTGSTILQGTTQIQNTLYGSSILVNTIHTEGPFIANQAYISSLYTEKVLGSTIESQYLVTPIMSVATLSSIYITAPEFQTSTLQSFYISTGVLYTADIYVSTFQAGQIQNTGFVDRIENLSTNNFLASTAVITFTSTQNISTTSLYTYSAQFNTVNTNSISTGVFTASTIVGNEISTNGISTNRFQGGALTVSSLLTNILSAPIITYTNARIDFLQGSTLSTAIVSANDSRIFATSTGILSTTQMIGSQLNTSTIRINLLSTTILRSQAPLNTFIFLSTNELSTNSFKAQTANIQSLQANTFTANNVQVPFIYSDSLSTNQISTGIVYSGNTQTSSLNANTIVVDSFTVNTGIFSTTQADIISTTLFLYTSTSIPLASISTGFLSTGGGVIVSTLNTTSLSTNAISTGIWTADSVLATNVLFNTISTLFELNITQLQVTNISAAIVSTTVFNASSLRTLISSVSTNEVQMAASGTVTTEYGFINALSTTSLSTITFFADTLTGQHAIMSNISVGIINTGSTNTNFLSTGAMDVKFLSTRVLLMSSINNNQSLPPLNTQTNFLTNTLITTSFIGAASSIIQSTFTSSLRVIGPSIVNPSLTLFNDFIIYGSNIQTLPFTANRISTTILATASTLSFNSTLFFDRSSFRVGINTATPQYELHVEGDIEQTSAIALKPTQGQWLVGSDRRIKENIELANINLCYSTAKEIHLYRYNFREGYRAAADSNVLGFLAQNVQSYFPKAVESTYWRGFDGLLSLNTSQLKMMHYGATTKLAELTESNETLFSSCVYPLRSVKDITQKIETQIQNQSTQFVTIHTGFTSTLIGNQSAIQSLSDSYDSLISHISTLLG